MSRQDETAPVLEATLRKAFSVTSLDVYAWTHRPRLPFHWKAPSEGILAGVTVILLVLLGCDTTESDPEPDDSTAFTTTSVFVQSDTLTLPGTLLMPDTSATVPGVVLVHGSGPTDRDGPGRPPVYKEWATQMAQQGLAVLRYDKRTTRPEVRQADPRAITFLDFVRDAAATGRFLRDRSTVDVDRLVLVGHSQGGNVAPAAATRLDGVAGVASLGGPALAIDSLLVAQLEAGDGMTGCTASRARAQFDSLRAGQSVAEDLICGAGTTFWRQWIRHSQKMDSVVAALGPPLLAQQGLSDRNYPGETLQQNIGAWRRGLGSDDEGLRTYEDVGHRFRPSVSPAPLDDLIAWVRGR